MRKNNFNKKADELLLQLSLKPKENQSAEFKSKVPFAGEKNMNNFEIVTTEAKLKGLKIGKTNGLILFLVQFSSNILPNSLINVSIFFRRDSSPTKRVLG